MYLHSSSGCGGAVFVLQRDIMYYIIPVLEDLLWTTENPTKTNCQERWKKLTFYGYLLKEMGG